MHRAGLGPPLLYDPQIVVCQGRVDMIFSSRRRAGAQLDFGGPVPVLCLVDGQSAVRGIPTHNRPPKSVAASRSRDLVACAMTAAQTAGGTHANRGASLGSVVQKGPFLLPWGVGHTRGRRGIQSDRTEPLGGTRFA